MSQRPNLTETQAREAVLLLERRMLAAPEGPPEKTCRSIAARLLSDWQAQAEGARFTVHAMYYGLANYAGLGVVDQ